MISKEDKTIRETLKKKKKRILKCIPKSKERKITMAILKKKAEEEGFTEQWNIIQSPEMYVCTNGNFT